MLALEGQMNQLEVQGFPQLAPLATPFVKLILERQETLQWRGALGGVSMHEQMEVAKRRIQYIWQHVENSVQEKRQQTFALMNPAVQVDPKTGGRYVLPGWLRETLATLMPPLYRGKRKEAVTAQTLAVWSEKHILRHCSWGQLEAQSAAAVIMARQLDETRERSWLPSEVNPDEPHWWCYSQAPPVNGMFSPVLPCPMPLAGNLAPATLLWTPWLGACWDPRWLQIGYLGAIRWAGATLDGQGQVQWNMPETELRKWDPEIVSLDMGFLRHTREMLNGVAHMALLRLALTRLKQSTLIDSIPF